MSDRPCSCDLCRVTGALTNINDLARAIDDLELALRNVRDALRIHSGDEQQKEGSD